MRLLLDTCVLRELRKLQGHEGVKQAILGLPDENLFLSVLTIGEIFKGIALLENGQKKRSLQAWALKLQTQFASSILPVDQETAQIWGELSAKASAQGTPLPSIDGLVAATALRYGLHLSTRNVKDFKNTGVLIFNPWMPSKNN